MCGKNFFDSERDFVVLGSPPRVREKHENSYSLYHTLGITPACAGKTRKQLLFVSYIRDHPRVCGKNNEISSASDACPGSPPRVREKLFSFM